MSEPCVSTVIPAYNAASTIERAVLSAVEQEHQLEIIIVNDCSTDETSEVVASLQRKIPQIRFLELQRNKGASVARNVAMGAAQGKYIAFLDADDVWLPGKIAKQVAVLESDPNVTIVSCNSLQLTAKGRYLKEAHESRPPVEGSEAWKTLLAYNFLPTPTIIVRKGMILNLGGFSAQLSVAEDLDLWIRLAALGGVSILPEVLVHYYDIPGSLMKSKGQSSEKLVLNLIVKHIDRNRSRLTNVEINRIVGCRYYDFGINRFYGGDYLGSVGFFKKSISMEYNLLNSILYILRAVIIRK